MNPGSGCYRHRPAHRAGHGRGGHLHHHRCLAHTRHRRPGPARGPARLAAASRPGMTALTVPEITHTACRPAGLAATARPCRALADLETPPPSPRPLVPPPHPARPQCQHRLDHKVNGRCLTRWCDIKPPNPQNSVGSAPPSYMVSRIRCSWDAPDAPRASRHFFAVALPPFSAPFREIGDNYMHSKCEGERTSAKRFGDRALYLALDVSGRSPNGTGSVLHTVQGQHISI